MRKIVSKLQKVFVLLTASVLIFQTTTFAEGITNYTPGLCTIKNFLRAAIQRSEARYQSIANEVQS